MKTSLWTEYWSEMWGAETFETEYGFITFQTFTQHIFIQELYVKPEFRRSEHASALADEVTKIARERGLYELTSKVHLDSNTAALSLKVQLAYGFIPFRAESGIIWLSKKVER